MYDNIHSSSLSSRSTIDCDEISLFLHHLLHSSSSSSSCMFDKSKPMLFSSPLPSPPLLVQSLPENQQPCLSTLLFSDSDCRVRNGTSTTESSAAVDTSGSILSSSGVYLPADVQATGNMSSVGFARDCDAVTATVKRGKFPADNYDLDDYDCESEEGVEGLEGATKPVPPRGSSKRSRAAEVHNLSEKRRRSRINEKMKALQNLIPNSNKTDKASMLDEAIEYLKQLQLQVQMLSMRNGLSLHPMYLPGLLQQPMQLPRMQMGFDEGNGSLHMNMETGTLPVNQEISRQNAFALSSQCISSQQAIVIPSVTNITNSETSFGLESPIQAHRGPFQLSTASEEIYREDIPQQQLVMNDLSVSLPFDTQASVLEDSNCVEAGVSRRERLEDVLPTDADNQILGHHLHCLQTGQHVPNYAMEIKTLDF